MSVVRGTIDDYATRHPDPEDVALVVEVTRSSVAKDRAMATIYGGGGIPAYWIVNLVDSLVEVYSDPDPAGGYGSRTDYRSGQAVLVTIDGRDVGQIAVADLLA